MPFSSNISILHYTIYCTLLYITWARFWNVMGINMQLWTHFFLQITIDQSLDFQIFAEPEDIAANRLVVIFPAWWNTASQLGGQRHPSFNPQGLVIWWMARFPKASTINTSDLLVDRWWAYFWEFLYCMVSCLNCYILELLDIILQDLVVGHALSVSLSAKQPNYGVSTARSPACLRVASARKSRPIKRGLPRFWAVGPLGVVQSSH